jgi:hypothetical protein
MRHGSASGMFDVHMSDVPLVAAPRLSLPALAVA